jgi:DNA-binding winged helix-turn-helix (wHTH) protein
LPVSKGNLVADSGQGAVTARRIDLVREDIRRIGPLTIDPPGRTIRHADGREAVLEPRTMQLLVALLDAGGAILSRDDLIESCWEGRIVGDDSISSVVYRLRRDLKPIAEGVIEIETVTKVGFRLMRSATDAAPGPAIAAAPAVPRRRAWRRYAAAIAVVVLLLAGGAFWLRGPETEERVLAISAPGAFGEELRSALAGFDVPLSASDGDLRLAIGQHAGQVDTRLDDLRSGRTIWSNVHAMPAGDRAIAADANRIADIVHCGLPAITSRRPQLTPAVVALAFRFCESEDRGIQLARARDYAAAAPDFADAQLARADAVAAQFLFQTPDAALRREGMDAADRVIAIKPGLGDGYVFRAMLLPFSEAAARERLLREGLARPSSCACAAQFLGDFLMQSGRLNEGLALYEQGYDRDPNALMPLLRYIRGLDIAGQTRRASDLLDAFEAKHGADPALRFSHTLYLVPRPWPLVRPPYGNAALEQAGAAAFAAIHDGGGRAPAAALLRAIPVTRTDEYPIAALLAELGDSEGALAVAEASRRAGNSFAAPGRYPGVTTALLWDPRLEAMWRAPGFADYLNRAGYFAYWRQSGSRPDICRSANAPAFCQRI